MCCILLLVALPTFAADAVVPKGFTPLFNDKDLADLSKVTEFKDKTPHPGKDRTTGHFGFAGHNDTVAFRGIEVRKIEEKKDK